MGAWPGGWSLGVASLLVACGSGYSQVRGPSNLRRILVPRDNSGATVQPEQCSKWCPAPLPDEESQCEDAGGSDELLADVAPGAHALVLCSYRRSR